MADTTCLRDMTNDAWLEAVLALGDTDEALDYIYASIDAAHDRSDAARIDDLLGWLDPTKLAIAPTLAVLSIAKTPTGFILPMAVGLNPQVPHMPNRSAFERRAVDHVRAQDPEDWRALVEGLVDPALCGEVTSG